MQTTDEQTATCTCTRGWVRWRQMLEEEKQRVCTQQWWPLSLVTDYRSLMLPQRLPQLVEMNHPSAFFCKPSITSDSAPQTSAHPPTTTHPPTSTDLQSYTLEEGAAQHIAAAELCWKIRPRKPPPNPLHPIPLTNSPFLPTLSLSCLIVTSPHPFFLIFLSSNFHSSSPPPVPVPPLCISLGGHLPARHLRGSKSLLTF